MSSDRARPIIFSSSSVEAILDGRKKQTRRICRPQPLYDDGLWHVFYPWGEGGHGIYESETELRAEYDRLTLWHCPYGHPGARLWVRETWAPHHDGIAYRASHCVSGAFRWRSPIHMPRAASRIVLEVKAVRVERLQEITEADAKAEGAPSFFERFPSIGRDQRLTTGELASDKPHRASFAVGWDELNAARAPWVDDPFVWVVSFERSS